VARDSSVAMEHVPGDVLIKTCASLIRTALPKKTAATEVKVITENAHRLVRVNHARAAFTVLGVTLAAI
jgi:hypothetical protein